MANTKPQNPSGQIECRRCYPTILSLSQGDMLSPWCTAHLMHGAFCVKTVRQQKRYFMHVRFSMFCGCTSAIRHRDRALFRRHFSTSDLSIQYCTFLSLHIRSTRRMRQAFILLCYSDTFTSMQYDNTLGAIFIGSYANAM